MPTGLSKKKIIIIAAAVAIVIGLVLFFLNLRHPASNVPTVKLTVWGTETQEQFQPLLAYPYAAVSYKQIDPADYYNEVESALAAGDGPDVFEINSRDFPKYKSIIAPFNASSSGVNPYVIQQYFPDVVSNDLTSNGQIYGLPLSIDTLAIAYNPDLFNAAGIAAPPKTWTDFDNDVQKLRILGSNGQIVQAAAAIGGSDASIPHATDILSLLMLQNGTQMTSADDARATFAASSGNQNGFNAFNFYLQFSNPSSPYYTWNDSMGNAFDSFAAGKTAIIFIYHSDIAALKAKAPFLNFRIASMPQPAGAPDQPAAPVNYPDYTVLVASRAGDSAYAANFISYAATTPALQSPYLQGLSDPPALRSDISTYANDPILSVFANQILTAQSWYQADSSKDDQILNHAIQNVLSGSSTSNQALEIAESSVTSLMQ